MKWRLNFILLAFISSCAENEQKTTTAMDLEQLQEGRWVMNFQLTPEQQLPVFFDLQKKITK